MVLVLLPSAVSDEEHALKPNKVIQINVIKLKMRTAAEVLRLTRLNVNNIIILRLLELSIGVKLYYILSTTRTISIIIKYNNSIVF